MQLVTKRDQDVMEEPGSPTREVMREALEQAEHWLQEHARNPEDSCEPVEMLRVIGEALAMDKTGTQLWEDIHEARAAWLRCSPGCEECSGFGWSVFNQVEVQTDDECRTGKRSTIEDDDEAQEVANLFTLYARRILGLFASGVIDAAEAHALARAMVPMDTARTR